ncbi:MULTISPECIES: hypothetical protein [Photorhabdus]|uniref:Uncharacterized protein n=2 Tax=Photorhabdus asymbiotica TaxID=291112 RepID=B6VLC7_PHOAA|nr:hypothetical protein [Photorhabdus asymbiotica]RKS59757.1 hypothetical protein BDD30_1844 [Photorhabdus asymbiotica]CAQ85901.1 conserved hypothetical Protein [Photorhabdus asymbiotica]CAR66957.1 Hypothetical Protein PA-RVA7-0659 [Photorhabdus asymbiotica subsp. asymbiotica ATCC 43949]
MKDIIYWNVKVQKKIDSYPDAVHVRINFELVALQNGYPHSFDNEARHFLMIAYRIIKKKYIVPSVIVPQENNLLVNLQHPGFQHFLNTVILITKS